MWLNAHYANGLNNRLEYAEIRHYSAKISDLPPGDFLERIFSTDCAAIYCEIESGSTSTLGITVAIRPCKKQERSTVMQATELNGTVRMGSGSAITDHAWQRMTSRGLSDEAVEAVLTYGRVAHTRGAEIHALGRREVELYRSQSVDLSPFEGIQVVCVPNNGVIMTVYRNHDFSSLRKDGRGWRRPRYRF